MEAYIFELLKQGKSCERIKDFIQQFRWDFFQEIIMKQASGLPVQCGMHDDPRFKSVRIDVFQSVMFISIYQLGIFIFHKFQYEKEKLVNS